MSDALPASDRASNIRAMHSAPATSCAHQGVRIAFIHITKVGGTMLDKSLQLGCGHKCVWSSNHDLKESLAEARKATPLVILRDPIDRLHSQFFYWRDGAETGGFKRSDFDKAANRRLYPTLNSFVDGLRQGSALANIIVTKKIGFTWDQHFAPQAYWMNGVHNQSYVVCYSKHKLVARTSALLRRLKIPCNLSAAAHQFTIPQNRLTGAVNPTIPYQHENLTEANLRWYRQSRFVRQGQDFQLWAPCADGHTAWYKLSPGHEARNGSLLDPSADSEADLE